MSFDLQHPGGNRAPPRQTSLARRLALVLAAHAVRAATPDRTGWSEAMANELHHLPADAALVRWALGCLLVSYSERFRLMTRWTVSVPRWLPRVMARVRADRATARARRGPPDAPQLRAAYSDFLSFQRLCDQGQSGGAVRICASTRRA